MEIWIISRHQKLNAAVVGRCFYNRRLFSGTGDNGNLFDHIEFGDKLAWEATECCLERSLAHYSERLNANAGRSLRTGSSLPV